MDSEDYFVGDGEVDEMSSEDGRGMRRVMRIRWLFVKFMGEDVWRGSFLSI